MVRVNPHTKGMSGAYFITLLNLSTYCAVEIGLGSNVENKAVSEFTLDSGKNELAGKEGKKSGGFPSIGDIKKLWQASSLMRSEISMCPAYSPSIAT